MPMPWLWTKRHVQTKFAELFGEDRGSRRQSGDQQRLGLAGLDLGELRGHVGVARFKGFLQHDLHAELICCDL